MANGNTIVPLASLLDVSCSFHQTKLSSHCIRASFPFHQHHQFEYIKEYSLNTIQKWTNVPFKSSSFSSRFPPENEHQNLGLPNSWPCSHTYDPLKNLTFFLPWQLVLQGCYGGKTVIQSVANKLQLTSGTGVAGRPPAWFLQIYAPQSTWRSCQALRIRGASQGNQCAEKVRCERFHSFHVLQLQLLFLDHEFIVNWFAGDPSDAMMECRGMINLCLNWKTGDGVSFWWMTWRYTLQNYEKSKSSVPNFKVGLSLPTSRPFHHHKYVQFSFPSCIGK